MITKNDIQSAKIAAMKAKDSFRSEVMGSILASIKQIEVDKRIDVDSNELINILNRMVKQRKESIESFSKANRMDLVEKESKELDIIQTFLPRQASDDEIQEVIDNTVASIDNPTIKSMGIIMKLVKEKLNGRADMSVISSIIKSKLGQ